MIALAVLAPFIAALLTICIRQRETRRFVRLASALGAAALAVAAAQRVDVLSQIFVYLVSSVGLLATGFSTGFFSFEWGVGKVAWSRKPIYFLLLGAFWSSMLLVVVAGDFAVLWMGIAATTLATTFLVGFSGEADSLEAAWKYLILCSFGIVIALLGTLLLGRAALAAGIDPGHALGWGAILAHHGVASSALARVAIALMIVGYATKAGLAPMHTWLPDAHSKAPAPISGLLSAVLVSCAMYAIMRTLSVADVSGLRGIAQTLLLSLGALSTLLAGMLMLAQRDLKRFLAYSTVEHVGIVAVALGFGGTLGILAALVHIINHAFAKGLAFFAAGLIQRERGTVQLQDLRGLWRSTPGKLLLAALIALSGMPPFGLFVSEFLMVLAGVYTKQWIALGITMLGIVLAFAAIARVAIGLESGEPVINTRYDAPRTSRISMAVAATTLAIALGVAIASWSPALSSAGFK